MISVVIVTLNDDIDFNFGSEVEYEVIIRKDKGITKARNMGIKQSKGDIIAFIDDDAIPSGYWLKNIEKNLKTAKGLVGKVIHNGGTSLTKRLAIHYDQGNKRKTTHMGVGCNMAFRKSVFESVGLFEETLSAYDETEFLYRFNQKYKLIYCPDVIVYHTYAESFYQYLKKRYRYGRDIRNFYSKVGGADNYRRYKFELYPPKKKRWDEKLAQACGAVASYLGELS